MAKKLSNMTEDERIAYWKKQREIARKKRQANIDHLDDDQRKTIARVYKWLDDVLDTAIHPDMGGIKMVSAYDLQELYDAKDAFSFHFNLQED